MANITAENMEEKNKSEKRSSDSVEDGPIKKVALNSEVPLLKRIKYRNYALFMSYCGKQYYGMQLQRSNVCPTIEDLLLNAMAEANLIEPKGKITPQNYHFQRASRTDKGVSAVRQVVSINLPENATDISTSINKFLPEDIRVFNAIRVTKSFNSKNWCDSRTYSYLCPTFAFAPVNAENEYKDYRMSPEQLKELNELFQLYVGCHRYHNFTSGKSFHDPSSKRYIVSMGTDEPFEREGQEWIIIAVHGHSFMLHQIRKMLGLVMAVSKGHTTKDVIQKAWGEDKVDIPKAPGLGLVLEEPHFHNYNKRFGSSHQALCWDSVNEKNQIFREKYIDSTIIETEITEGSMLGWLSTLPLHIYLGRDDDIDGGTEKESSSEPKFEELTKNGENTSVILSYETNTANNHSKDSLPSNESVESIKLDELSNNSVTGESLS